MGCCKESGTAFNRSDILDYMGALSTRMVMVMVFMARNINLISVILAIFMRSMIYDAP